MTYWHCVCDCGRECDKPSQELRRNKYISCGVCSRRKVRNDCEDLTGKKYGKLTVIKMNIEKRNEALDNHKYHGTYWDCLCDCGNMTTVKSNHLKGGKIVSCGCYQKDLAKNIIPKLNWKTNEIINSEENILIKSSNSNDYFIIDIEDYEKVKNYCWCNSHGYAVASIRGEKNKFVRMHRLIMDCGEEEDLLVVDHINHNTLDNRKSNLRLATDTQNRWNSESSHNCGIQYNPTFKKWEVTIIYKLQSINLGSFDSYDEALDIRDKAEKVFYGEFQYKEGNNHENKNIS